MNKDVLVTIKGLQNLENTGDPEEVELVAKGDYYFKITRNEDTAERNEEISYALQVSMGANFKHDYVMKEQESEDTQNKTESKIPLTTSSTGSLSSVNALEIQATKYQATAQMLEVGYLNMANIYNKNSKF